MEYMGLVCYMSDRSRDSGNCITFMYVLYTLYCGVDPKKFKNLLKSIRTHQIESTSPQLYKRIEYVMENFNN